MAISLDLLPLNPQLCFHLASEYIGTLSPSKTSAQQQIAKKLHFFCFMKGWGWNIKETPKSSTNTVLFGAYTLETHYNPSVSDKCGARFADVFQCTQVKKSPASITDCNGAFCRSCKTSFPTTTPYYVEIGKLKGHLHYQDVWYKDDQRVGATGNWEKFSTAECK